jgi:K+-sensing histidine kinase KdpD
MCRGWVLSCYSGGMSSFNNNEAVSWHRRVLPGSIQAYAFATLCVALGSLLHWGIGLISEDSQVFTTFYPAVLFAALVGGAGAGVYAALLSGITAWWAFMPPHFALFPLTSGLAISLLIYFFACSLIVWAADHYRRLTKRLEDEEKFRKLTVEELAHRLKNKIATIQAIISFQLRDDPQTREAIIGRLSALSATDDLILEAQPSCDAESLLARNSGMSGFVA